MPKVTRPATARKPAPKKGPVFPIRKPKLVTAADVPNIAPMNAGKVRAHYTRQGWLMWGIMGLCAVLGVFFSQQILSAYNWVRIETNERVYTDLGRDLCSRPLMNVPEYTCTAGELDCFTVPQEAVIKRYEEQARAHNLWQAESCIPLM